MFWSTKQLTGVITCEVKQACELVGLNTTANRHVRALDQVYNYGLSVKIMQAVIVDVRVTYCDCKCYGYNCTYCDCNSSLLWH